MGNIRPTKEALLLNRELNKAGILTELEHWDGHKHVDIYVPTGKLYIEIDGEQHYTSVTQISSDFRRDHYSELEGYRTFRIPSFVVEKKLKTITKAILEILNFEM
jgi:very-short-patch-repair endonuclease